MALPTHPHQWMTAYHTGKIKDSWRFGRYTEPAHVAYVYFVVVPYGINGTQWMTAYHTGRVEGNSRLRGSH